MPRPYQGPSRSDPEPVVDLDQEDVLRRPAKQGAGVVAEVDGTARERRGAAARPHEVHGRTGPVLPAQDRVAAQRPEREARVLDREGPGGSAPVDVDEDRVADGERRVPRLDRIR